MGSYTGDRDGSSTDDSTDDEPERDPNQPELDDFDEPDSDNPEEDDSGSSAPTAPVPGSGGSGGGGGAAPVTEEPPEDDPDEEKSDDGEPDEVEEPTEPEIEEPDDVEEEGPEDEHEAEDEDDNEDDEEDETVTVAITADPLSALSWGIQPVVTRVEENYGDQVEFEYNVAPVRTFEAPEEMRQQWGESTELHEMPVDLSFWDDPPESTEQVNRALVAAMRQGAGEPYLRALWREGIAGGQNLNDKVALDSLASRLGLDVDKFQEDMEDADLETGSELDELPVTQVRIKGYTQTWTGNVHYIDFKEQFIFEGLDEGKPRDPDVFVEEHAPVATAEVMEVYQWDLEKAINELRGTEGIYLMNIGESTFWVSE